MTPKEFKAEMKALVENAKCTITNEGTRWEDRTYKSVVGNRTYEWRDQDPRIFVMDLIRKFNSETRRENKVELKADNTRINKRQDALAWLWNNKNLWKDLQMIYRKYEKHREEIKTYKYKEPYKRCISDNWWRAPEFRKTHDLIEKMESETNKTLGRKDLFFLYDSMPYNWLAMA